MEPCISPSQLERYLDEQLGDFERARIEAHVEGCTFCQRILEELTEEPWEGGILTHRLFRAARRDVEAGEEALDLEFLHRLQEQGWNHLRETLAANLLDPTLEGDGEALPPEEEDSEALTGYEVLEELGRGSMGVVYKARHLRLGRIVALKMILTSRLSSPQALTRFRTEAEALARLQHPNVVQVYEIGEWGKQPFLVLEYLEGGNLADRLDGKPQPPAEAAQLVERLARAIHAAHECGIIHRDLKPANVLLTLDGTPKVSDFGLAKQLDDVRGQTASGVTIGTPGYLAPEQASGHVGHVGPAADVYSLGSILYELLTGRPPFQGASDLETVVRELTEEPVSPHRLTPSLPRDLVTICLKCIEKEPGRRYASAAALADDLHRYLQGQPIMARPVGALERGWKWTRRQPGLASLLVAVAITTLFGVASLSWALVQAEERALALGLAKQEEAGLRQKAEDALYLSHIAQAELRWEKNDLPKTLSLLHDNRDGDRAAGRLGWEWNYLNRLCHGSLVPPLRHFGWVYGLAFSSNGKWLAVGAGVPVGNLAGSPGDLKLWDADTGAHIASLQGHKGAVGHVAFSPDSSRLLSASFDGTVRLWDMVGRREVLRLDVPPYTGLLEDIHDPLICFDAGLMLLAQRRNMHPDVTLWSLQTGQANQTLHHASPVTALAMSANGRRVVTLAADGEIRTWDAATGMQLASWKGGPGRLAVAPDGRLLACNTGDRRPVVVCETDTGREVRRCTARGSVVAFTQDGQVLLTLGVGFLEMSQGKTLDLASGQEGLLAFNHQSFCNGAALSPCGLYVATASADRTVRVTDLRAGTEARVFRGPTFGVLRVAFSPDSTRLASGDQQGQVWIWDLTCQQRGQYLTGAIGGERANGEWVGNLAFRDGPEELVGVHYRSGIHSCDAATGEAGPSHRVPLQDSPRTPRFETGFSPDGNYLAAVLRDRRTVKVWDTRTGAEVFASSPQPFLVACVGLSNGAARIAISGYEFHKEAGRQGIAFAAVKVWDRRSGRDLFDARPDASPCLAFSADGRLVAVAGGDTRRAIVWEVDSQRVVREFPEPHPNITAMAFSPDGGRLATGNYANCAVRLWDLARGTPIGFDASGQGLGGPRQLTGLAFSPDGRRLAAVGADGHVTIWDAGSGQEVLVLRGRGPDRPVEYSFNARVAFSQDGSRLAANNYCGGITVWDAPEAAAGEEQRTRRLRDATRRAYHWHLQHADSPFHRRQVEALAPPTPAARRARAALYAAEGLWSEAAADFAQAPRLADGPRDLVVRAALFLLAGNLAAYRELAEPTPEPQRGDAEGMGGLAWICSLRPESADPQKSLQLAEEALAADRANPERALVLALCLYRAGRLQDAGTVASTLRPAAPQLAGCCAWLLALLHHRAGRHDLAQQERQLAEAWLAKATEDHPEDRKVPHPLHPAQWLTFQLLRREAAEALQGKSSNSARSLEAVHRTALADTEVLR